MAKPKKKEDPTEFIPTPYKQRTQMSGWCYDADHKSCPMFFSFGICGCDCEHAGQRQWPGLAKFEGRE